MAIFEDSKKHIQCHTKSHTNAYLKMVEVLYLRTDSVDAMDLPMDVALQVPVAFGDVALQMHVEVGYLQNAQRWQQNGWWRFSRAQLKWWTLVGELSIKTYMVWYSWFFSWKLMGNWRVAHCQVLCGEECKECWYPWLMGWLKAWALKTSDQEAWHFLICFLGYMIFVYVFID